MCNYLHRAELQHLLAPRQPTSYLLNKLDGYNFNPLFFPSKEPGLDNLVVWFLVYYLLVVWPVQLRRGSRASKDISPKCSKGDLKNGSL